MNLYSKIALLTVAIVRICRAVAVMLGQLGINNIVHYHLSEEGAKQTIQNLSGKKSKYWAFLRRFEGRFSNKRTFTKS